MSLRLIVLLLVTLAAACDRQKGEAPQAPVEATAEVKGVDRSRKGTAAPAVTFRDPDGGDTSIAAFKGTPVLVNLWASWCAPCVKELPTLERLAASSGDRLQVIAVSQDMAPASSVEAFLAKQRIGAFAAHHDEEMALSSALSVQVMPTTVLYDSAGKEVWRYTGDLDWSGTEARALIAEAS